MSLFFFLILFMKQYLINYYNLVVFEAPGVLSVCLILRGIVGKTPETIIAITKVLRVDLTFNFTITINAWFCSIK